MDANRGQSGPEGSAGFSQIPNEGPGDEAAGSEGPNRSSETGRVVERCDVSRILPLRHAVLRPGLAFETAMWEGDDDPTTRHYAALDGEGGVIGCATVLLNEYKGQPAMQLRGMAVDAALAGRGVGSTVLRFVHDDLVSEPHVVDSNPVGLIWANARKIAVPFYLRHGYAIDSDEFEIAGVGPHRVIVIQFHKRALR